MLTPNELVLHFGGSYVCANFGENRSRNATVRVLADRQTDRLTDANRFYNLSHAICYSYGTDNKPYSGHKVAEKQSDKNTWKVDLEKETDVDSTSRYSWRKMEKIAQNRTGR